MCIYIYIDYHRIHTLWLQTPSQNVFRSGFEGFNIFSQDILSTRDICITGTIPRNHNHCDIFQCGNSPPRRKKQKKHLLPTMRASFHIIPKRDKPGYTMIYPISCSKFGMAFFGYHKMGISRYISMSIQFDS